MNLDNLSALDIETAPTVQTDKPYALEPWRQYQSRAKITCITVRGLVNSTWTDPSADDIKEILRALKGQYVVAHNALFDIGWMIPHVGYDTISGIKWVDSSLLSKWIHNGQSAEEQRMSHSLIACCNRWLQDHPRIEEFNDVKFQSVKPGENFEYWLERNKLDTEMTLSLFKAMWVVTPSSQKRGFLIEQRALAPLARGWLHGIPVDSNYVDHLNCVMETKKNRLCAELGVTPTLLNSPKQKCNLLFNTWGLTPVDFTPKGNPSAGHDSLTRLHQMTQDPKFDRLMAAIKLSTLQSKYTKGFARAKGYVGADRIFGVPRIFGTYTGRMTYGSKTFAKKQDTQVSIAMHQMPRKAKAIKHAMKADEGYGILYIDANSQELRMMACRSGDRTMVHGYQKGMDLHSSMTAAIYGRPYEEVVEGNFNDDKEIMEERQSGKLVNLSCMYRIGAKSLANKFFTTYEKDIAISDAQRYLSMYKRQYPGVKDYWKEAVQTARGNGYANTFAGRRYYIDKFDWKGESSAINFPIQGAGAEHTLATIGIINHHHPECILLVQVHDALIYMCPLDTIEETARHVMEITSGDIYNRLFDVDFPINMPFDAQIGDSLGNLKGIK